LRLGKEGKGALKEIEKSTGRNVVQRPDSSKPTGNRDIEIEERNKKKSGKRPKKKKKKNKR